MDCPGSAASERIESYLRGGLRVAERDELELHYLGCRSCFEEVQLRLAVYLALAGARDPAVGGRSGGGAAP